MNYPLVIRSEAEADLADAKRWYEQQRHGLGNDFLLCVEEALNRIRRTPEMHTIVYKEVRRSLVRRFPYVIYYRVEAKQVVVLAVFHSHRDPKQWRSRR